MVIFHPKVKKTRIQNIPRLFSSKSSHKSINFPSNHFIMKYKIYNKNSYREDDRKKLIERNRKDNELFLYLPIQTRNQLSQMTASLRLHFHFSIVKNSVRYLYNRISSHDHFHSIDFPSKKIHPTHGRLISSFEGARYTNTRRGGILARDVNCSLGC